MSRVALLDVNVLVALAWPNHQAHAAARSWFAEHAGETGWATTPVTESGFVRVSCNRRVLPAVASPSGAVGLLQELTAARGHRFWPDEIRDVMHPALADRLRGHMQVTDAHLLTLVDRHGGQLVTFDQAITQLAGDIPVCLLTM